MAETKCRASWSENKKMEKDITLSILQTEVLTRGSLYFAKQKETWKYQLPGWYKIKNVKNEITNKQAI